MTISIEFINDLANTPMSLIEIDTSDLKADATTINITQTQIGTADAFTAATNEITFGPVNHLISGNFTLQHADINSGDPLEISVNNVNVHSTETTAGVVPVTGTNAVFTINIANGQPNSNYLWLTYNGDTMWPMTIKYDGTEVLFYGGSYGSIQGALDGHFGSGVWTYTGNLSSAFHFTGPTQTFGSSPWTIQHDYWSSIGHPATASFTDGMAGVNQKYVLNFNQNPTTGVLYVYFQGVYVLSINPDATSINFNGSGPFSSIQECFDSVINPSLAGYGSHHGGPWTCAGLVSKKITFIGPSSPIGAQPWSISNNFTDATVTDEWTDGVAPTAGTQAVHSLYFDGAFDGTFTVEDSAAFPWNSYASTIQSAWNNHVATVSSVTGTGISTDPWIITYQDKTPQSLPTIDESGLVGFYSGYLQTQAGSNFTVTKNSESDYTFTSVAEGAGQNAIDAANFDMLASVSYQQPIMQTAGSAGTGGANAVYTITMPSTPNTGRLLLSYTGNIFSIQINSDNTDVNGDSIQTRLNNIGLGGWTYAGSPASHTMTFTYTNAQQPFMSNPWNVTSNTFSTGVGIIIVNLVFNDGAYPAGTAQCVQTWVSPEQQGATGGTFTIIGTSHTVGPCAYNMNLTDLSSQWVTATGQNLAYSTGLGTELSPYEFHFADNIAVSLPNIDGSLLTKSGTISNDFTDGTTDLGDHSIQTVELADNPTSGQWAITWSDQTLSPLDYNIAHGDLQAALRSVWFNNAITVSGSNPYVIDFGMAGDMSTITADGSSLRKGVTAIINRSQIGQDFN